MTPAERIAAAIRAANDEGRPAIVAFLTAGFPARDRFLDDLAAIARAADVVEIGVPFTDPMADGVTIQRASRAALDSGVTLRWIIDELDRFDSDGHAPLLLMGYLNPLLSMGYAELAERSARAGVCGFIVPDLPYDESGPFRRALDEQGQALVQLVTPVTPPERMATLCEASGGFVYAVTVTGITGGGKSAPSMDAVTRYLDQVRASASLPVCAGFGIRTADQAAALAGHADGVVVGSALVEAMERGDDPARFLRSLRGEV